MLMETQLQMEMLITRNALLIIIWAIKWHWKLLQKDGLDKILYFKPRLTTLMVMLLPLSLVKFKKHLRWSFDFKDNFEWSKFAYS